MVEKSVRENALSRRGSKDSQLKLVSWPKIEDQFFLFEVHCKKIAQYSCLLRITVNFILAFLLGRILLQENYIPHLSDIFIIPFSCNLIIDIIILLKFFIFCGRSALLFDLLVLQWVGWLLAGYGCLIFSCLWFLRPHMLKFSSPSILRSILEFLLAEEYVFNGSDSSARLYSLSCIGMSLLTAIICAECYYATVLYKYYNEETTSPTKTEEEKDLNAMTLREISQSPMIGV